MHHGDGTQAIFDADPDLCYASTHQWPFYPGTGSAEERGSGPAIGTKHNVPLPAGSGDDAFTEAWLDQLLPAVEDFAPEAILVSAGYDAHRADPLAMLRVTEQGFGAVAEATGRRRAPPGAFAASPSRWRAATTSRAARQRRRDGRGPRPGPDRLSCRGYTRSYPSLDRSMARARVSTATAGEAARRAKAARAEPAAARPGWSIISGLSGAGKSQASKLLEDLGYFCVDNLPPELLDGFLALRDADPERYQRVALMLDIRAGDPAAGHPTRPSRPGRAERGDAGPLPGGERHDPGQPLQRDSASASRSRSGAACRRASLRSDAGWPRRESWPTT